MEYRVIRGMTFDCARDRRTGSRGCSLRVVWDAYEASEGATSAALTTLFQGQGRSHSSEQHYYFDAKSGGERCPFLGLQIKINRQSFGLLLTFAFATFDGRGVACRELRGPWRWDSGSYESLSARFRKHVSDDPTPDDSHIFTNLFRSTGHGVYRFSAALDVNQLSVLPKDEREEIKNWLVTGEILGEQPAEGLEDRQRPPKSQRKGILGSPQPSPMAAQQSAQDSPLALATILPPHFVPGFRREQLEHALQALERGRMLEVMGAPGMGKSLFIHELLTLFHCPPSGAIPRLVHVSIFDCHRPEHVAALLLHSAGEVISGPTMPIGPAIRKLSASPLVVWIERYDDVSAPACRQFLQQIAYHYRTAIEPPPACWIVESLASLSIGEFRPLQLRPLNDGEVLQILRGCGEEDALRNLEEVVYLANGNPLDAVTMSRTHSSDQSASEPSLAIAWFLQGLPHLERRVLLSIAVALDNSPLGTTVNQLLKYLQGVLPGSPLRDEIQKALLNVLGRLDHSQLLRIPHIHREHFSGELQSALVASLDLTFVEHPHRLFLRATLKQIDPATQSMHFGQWKRTLQDGDEDEGCGPVTAALLDGDLLPFWNSIFRATHSWAVVQWMNRREQAAISPRQAFIGRVIRARLRSDLSPELLVQSIGEPDAKDAVQVEAFAELMVDAISGVDGARPIQIDAVEGIYTHGAVVRKALAKVRLHRHRAEHVTAWNLVSELLRANGDGDETTRCQILQKASWLLDQKDVRDALSMARTSKVRGDIPSNSWYAEELARSAARLENLTWICDGLFFHVRHLAHTEGLVAPRTVTRHEVALTFIERTLPSRRLQVLLTRGSIHRHFCRSEDLSWKDFEAHAELAVCYYGRATAAALQRNSCFQAFNACSFVLAVSIMGLRYASSEASSAYVAQIAAWVRQALSLHRDAESYLHRLPSAAVTDFQERSSVLLSHIAWMLPVVGYAACVAAPAVDPELNDFMLYSIDRVVSAIAANRLSRDSLQSRIRQLCKELHRAYSFGRRCAGDRTSERLPGADASVRRLLAATRSYADRSKYWKRLNAALPPELRLPEL